MILATKLYNSLQRNFSSLPSVFKSSNITVFSSRLSFYCLQALKMHLPPLPSPAGADPSLIYPSLLSSSPVLYPSIASLPTSSLFHALPLPPNLPSHQLESIPGHLHPITIIHLSTTSRLVLKTAPSSQTPLLRHERLYLVSETAVLTLLAKSSIPIPRILKHNTIAATSSRSSRPFLLTTHLPGISYALARPYLTRSERLSIECQLTSLLSHISQHSSPRFGPVALVAEGKGFLSWKEAVEAMMESVLMDAEDMLVALPFGEIRYVVQRMGPELNQVKEARLTFGLGAMRAEEVGEGERKLGGVGILIDRRGNEITGLVGLGGAVWGDDTYGDGDGAGREAL